jgi:hypothetical protein
MGVQSTHGEINKDWKTFLFEHKNSCTRHQRTYAMHAAAQSEYKHARAMRKSEADGVWSHAPNISLRMRDASARDTSAGADRRVRRLLVLWPLRWRLPARARVNMLHSVVRGPGVRVKRARAPLHDFPGLSVRAGTANTDPTPVPPDVVAAAIVAVIVFLSDVVVKLVPPSHRPARRHTSPAPCEEDIPF